MRKRAGFTLVEIVIVAAIIGLLAMITVPSFVRSLDASRTTVCINNLRQISSAKSQHALEVGKNSGELVGLVDLDGFMKTAVTELHEPAGGDYHVNPVGDDPTCTVGGQHVL